MVNDNQCTVTNFIFVMITILVSSSIATAGVILYVNDDNCPGPGDGTINNPYCSIQDAIDAAMDGDEVEVLPGTYLETINFLGKAITLRSSDGAELTVIDAQQTGSVITFDSGEEADTVLLGFTITGGSGTIDPEFDLLNGGGMYIDSSNPTVTNCIFVGNQADRGGGSFSIHGDINITNCTFSENSAELGGGGMFNMSCSPTIISCTFNGNSSELSYGGGIYNNWSNPTVTECTFSKNYADQGGSGMFNHSSTPIVTDCTFEGNLANRKGGGMRNSSSRPTLTNCTFTANSANEGGGLHNQSSAATITNCTFIGNIANRGGGMYDDGSSPTMTNCEFIGNQAIDGAGGGMVIHSTFGTITDSVFTGNSATTNGGGMEIVTSNTVTVTNSSFNNNSSGDKGGGIYYTSGSLRLTKCTFIENTALNGGGMYSYFLSNPTLTDCTFRGNLVSGSGGGIYNFTYLTLTLTNCILSENSAGDNGGGIFNYKGIGLTMANCTLSENSAKNGSALAFDSSRQQSPSIFVMTNCILWNGGNEIWNNDESSLTISYTDVQGGWAGAGSNNIDADPLFVNPGSGDYRLASGSPCIDAGHNWHVPVDVNDYDEDGILCELFPVDLDGNPRFNADEVDFDTGCGVPVVVDMGAYEYQFDPADQVTFADLTGDNAVNTSDLLELFADWGNCDKGCCLADLDLDGTVNTTDLLILFTNWGACN